MCVTIESKKVCQRENFFSPISKVFCFVWFCVVFFPPWVVFSIRFEIFKASMSTLASSEPFHTMLTMLLKHIQCWCTCCRCKGAASSSISRLIFAWLFKGHFGLFLSCCVPCTQHYTEFYSGGADNKLDFSVSLMLDHVSCFAGCSVQKLV